MTDRRVFLATAYLMLSTLTARAQFAAVPGADQHPLLVQNSDGSLQFRGSGSRPVAAAITALRREYGWVVDYEESKPTESEIETFADGRRQLRDATVDIQLPSPNVSIPYDPTKVSGEAARVLKVMAAQFTSDSRGVTMSQPSRFRFSIENSAAGEWLLLDTIITLPVEPRSADATIDAICSEAARIRGTACVSGGFIDRELVQTQLTIGAERPVEARQLLAQVLDSVPHRKVWLLTYEPSEDRFVIGIQPAVRVARSPTNPGAVQLIPRLP